MVNVIGVAYLKRHQVHQCQRQCQKGAISDTHIHPNQSSPSVLVHPAHLLPRHQIFPSVSGMPYSASQYCRILRLELDCQCMKFLVKLYNQSTHLISCHLYRFLRASSSFVRSLVKYSLSTRVCPQTTFRMCLNSKNVVKKQKNPDMIIPMMI